jgi:hypothetical protein
MKLRLPFLQPMTGGVANGDVLGVAAIGTSPVVAIGPAHEADAETSGDHSHDHVHRNRSSAKLSAHQHHHPHLVDLTADTDLNGHSHAVARVKLPWENADEEEHDGSYLDPDVPALN